MFRDVHFEDANSCIFDVKNMTHLIQTLSTGPEF